MFNPAYDDFFLDNDLAIYELDQDVLGIDPSPIFRGTPLVGDLLTLVGYGAGGTGNEGHNGDFGTKRVGTTPIDGVEATILTWTFDNNSESNTAPGDSGGPAFLEVDGILHLAGITSGGDQPDAGIGDHSFDTRVDVFQDWIDAIVEDTTEGGGGEVGENLPGQLVTVAGNQTAIADFGNRQIDDGIQNGSVIWGTVWNDVNGDGLRDTTEVITVASDDVPQLISDEDLTTVVSELVIDSAAGTIADVNVVFDISHTWVDDLTVELISPAGTRVLLFDQVGLDGDDFSNTTLDDESTQSILGGTAPFTGIYQPQESLSMLAGEFAEGIWTLEVVDNWNLDGGFLNSWSLEIEMEGSLESGLEGRTVYLDLNGNGTLEEIGVEEVITVVSADVPQLISDEGRKTEVITVASDDVPQLISDEDLTTVVSELVIDSAAGTIADVNVVFDISHTWVDDLTVELISPAGTRVLLFDQVGLDGDDFSNTTLDDESTQSILDGTAPFTGIYQPQESLSMLAGEFAEGIWTLEVVDNWDLDGGFLNSWSLEIEMEGSFAESSTLVVSELVIDTTETTIADINVALDISHTWVYDLTVELISPAGTRVLLFDQVGSDGDDFSNTTLDDESSESILDGVAPFTGVYQPQEPLAMLVGEPVNGIWTLEILDSWDLDGGFLNSWSLEITTEGSLAEPSTQTDENGQYAFKDLQDDTYVVAQVLPFGWKETLPSTGNHTVSVSSAEIGAAVDFGSRLSIGAADIDALFDEIHSGNHNTSFDFTGDGLVDQQDMDELIENILGTTYGDTDLDGDVDTVDLITAINNFINASSTAIGWATGDLDGDGDVDTNDLTQLIGNFTSAKWEW